MLWPLVFGATTYPSYPSYPSPLPRKVSSKRHPPNVFPRFHLHLQPQRKRQDEERAATIKKIQEAAAKSHESGAASGPAGVGGTAGLGLGGVGRGRGRGGGAGAPGPGGDIAALDASMGRGRGRGLSNLPAWMTKGKPGGATGSSEGMPVRVRVRDCSAF